MHGVRRNQRNQENIGGQLFCNVYNARENVVVACCDRELLGKNLKEGNYDVTIEESFYKGTLTDEKKLAELLKEANSINLFGKKSVGVALKQGFLSERDIIRIAGVPHAIILKV